MIKAGNPDKIQTPNSPNQVYSTSTSSVVLFPPHPVFSSYENLLVLPSVLNGAQWGVLGLWESETAGVLVPHPDTMLK